MYSPLLKRFCVLYQCASILTALSCASSFTAQPSNPPTKKEASKKEPEKHFDFDEIIYNWTRTFAEVVHLAKDKHYKIADPQECMIKSIDSFLTCLDPHSSFLDPKTYKSIQESTSGEFFGIGIVIDNTRQAKDKFLTVVDILPDGPADKIGLLPYDKIVEIDGTILEGMTTEQATAKLKGERNSKVAVKIMREGKTDPLNFTITRDVIKEQSSLCFYIKEYDVYYVSLTTFSDNAVRQIKELLQKSSKQSKGLILDLRNNSGGLLSAAIDIAGLFIDKGSLVVTTKDKTGAEIDRYVTTQQPIANTALPIFVLINNYTASAGEILAGCLKIHSEDAAKKNKAKNGKKLQVFVVGTRSFGKGSVQEVVPVSNECAAKITTSLYFLPNDRSVQGIGIEPDFVIDRQFQAPEQVVWFNKNYGRERALQNYIKIYDEPTDDPVEENNDDDKTKKKSWAERMRKQLAIDNQFKCALTLSNMLNTAKTSCPHTVTTRDNALKFLTSNFVAGGTISMEEIKI